MHFTLHYRGRPAATVEGERVAFCPSIEVLERDHPLRRFVAAMCLYLRDVADGVVPGPSAELATLYARLLLIPSEALAARTDWADAVLAEHFNVPLEEIRERRLDLELLPGLT